MYKKFRVFIKPGRPLTLIDSITGKEYITLRLDNFAVSAAHASWEVSVMKDGKVLRYTNGVAGGRPAPLVPSDPDTWIVVAIPLVLNRHQGETSFYPDFIISIPGNVILQKAR